MQKNLIITFLFSLISANSFTAQACGDNMCESLSSDLKKITEAENKFCAIINEKDMPELANAYKRFHFDTPLDLPNWEDEEKSKNCEISLKYYSEKSGFLGKWFKTDYTMVQDQLITDFGSTKKMHNELMFFAQNLKFMIDNNLPFDTSKFADIPTTHSAYKKHVKDWIESDEAVDNFKISSNKMRELLSKHYMELQEKSNKARAEKGRKTKEIKKLVTPADYYDVAVDLIDDIQDVNERLVDAHVPYFDDLQRAKIEIIQNFRLYSCGGKDVETETLSVFGCDGSGDEAVIIKTAGDASEVIATLSLDLANNAINESGSTDRLRKLNSDLCNQNDPSGHAVRPSCLCDRVKKDLNTTASFQRRVQEYKNDVPKLVGKYFASSIKGGLSFLFADMAFDQSLDQTFRQAMYSVPSAVQYAVWEENYSPWAIVGQLQNTDWSTFNATNASSFWYNFPIATLPSSLLLQSIDYTTNNYGNLFYPMY